jgi:hypothetical protein
LYRGVLAVKDEGGRPRRLEGGLGSLTAARPAIGP